MMTFNAMNAFELPRQLFPEADFDTALSRYYEAQNDIAIAVSGYRHIHHLSQADLARKLNVSQAMISKYESGDYNISLKAAFELFDKLGMRFSCKIEGDPSMRIPASFDLNALFSCISVSNNTVASQNADEPLVA